MSIQSELFSKLRHRLEQVGHQADVRDLEDRGVLVLVDGDDGLGILHARKVLDRARNADGNIDFRSDDLAGLADLVVVGDIARIDRRAARADPGAELVGERGDDLFEGFRSFSARPPETITLALVSSGRSLSAISSLTKVEMPASVGPETSSISAEPPSAAAFSKAVPRTVTTSLASDDSTVAIALPA